VFPQEVQGRINASQEPSREAVSANDKMKENAEEKM